MAGNTVTIQARIPPELARQVKLAAELDGRSLSDALRHLMRAYVASLANPRTDDAAPVKSGVAQANRNAVPTAPTPSTAGHT